MGFDGGLGRGLPLHPLQWGHGESWHRHRMSIRLSELRYANISTKGGYGYVSALRSLYGLVLALLGWNWERMRKGTEAGRTTTKKNDSLVRPSSFTTDGGYAS